MFSFLRIIFFSFIFLCSVFQVTAMDPVCPSSQDIPDKSLYAYFGIEPFEYMLKDVKNLIAKEVVGQSGWWHPMAKAWAEGCVSLNPNPDAQEFFSLREHEYPAVDVTKIIFSNDTIDPRHELELEKITKFQAGFINPSGSQVAVLALPEGVGLLKLCNYKDKKVGTTHSLALNEGVNDAAFSSNGTLLAAIALTEVAVWNTASGMRMHQDSMGSRLINGKKILFSHESHVVMLDAPGFIKFWDIKKNVFSSFLITESELTCIAVHPTERLLIAASYDIPDRFFLITYDQHFNVTSRKECITKAGNNILSVAFAPHKPLCVLGLENDDIVLCSFDGQCVGRLRLSTEVANDTLHREGAIKFYDHGHRLISSTNGKMCVLWKELNYPSLEQILFRTVLKKYFFNCIAHRERPSVGDDEFRIQPLAVGSCNNLVPWMSKKFKIKSSDLQKAWQSFPDKFKISIICSLFTRVIQITAEQMSIRNDAQ